MDLRIGGCPAENRAGAKSAKFVFKVEPNIQSLIKNNDLKSKEECSFIEIPAPLMIDGDDDSATPDNQVAITNRDP